MSELTAEQVEAAFGAETQRRNLKKCKVGNIIEANPALGPKIMDVEHYSARQVSRVLKALDLGHTADHTITTHRKGACICPAPDKEPTA